jgi:hypothetical protein
MVDGKTDKAWKLKKFQAFVLCLSTFTIHEFAVKRPPIVDERQGIWKSGLDTVSGAKINILPSWCSTEKFSGAYHCFR